MKKMTTALAALALMATGASAATLTGDTVTKVITNNGSPVLNESFAVGVGVDDVDSSVNYDLDAGVNGDQLSITVNNGNFCGMYGCSGVTELTFSDLDFSGGASLIGFNVIDDGPLDITARVVEGSTLKLSWTEGDITGGTFTLGQYVTDMNVVPLPAGGLLLLTGLGAIAVARRRKS